MFIDHGLLRKGEAEGVMNTFSKEIEGGFNMILLKSMPKKDSLVNLKELAILRKNVKLSEMSSYMYLMKNVLNYTTYHS